MATDEDRADSVMTKLGDAEWQTTLRGVEDAERWLRALPPGDHRAEPVLEALIALAVHRKWEVRHALASLAASMSHPDFEPVLARFVLDDNERVRDAAKRAALRRRDWQNAGAFGKQHEERINATLDGIEARFGAQGRQAVKRASEQIADTFARELYHEVVKIVVPVASAAERLASRLAEKDVSPEALTEDAAKIERRVTHLKAVLDAMRAYTAVPKLRFAEEDMGEVILEALMLARDQGAAALLPSKAEGGPAAAEVAKPRMLQALTNLLMNALESYAGVPEEPIVVRLEGGPGWIAIDITDRGCGMRRDVLAESTTLFTTTKANGTGFGLPLVKKIVESEHGGRLVLSSEQGKGTTARIVIPVRRPAMMT